jgi:hypothetical protein
MLLEHVLLVRGDLIGLDPVWLGVEGAQVPDEAGAPIAAV